LDLGEQRADDGLRLWRLAGDQFVRDLRRHAFMMRRSKRLASPMPENFTPDREVGRAAADACCRQRGPAASVRRLTGAPCFWAIIDW
jgi:hypothetical protein